VNPISEFSSQNARAASLQQLKQQSGARGTTPK
jgi:hypothetical protein